MKRPTHQFTSSPLLEPAPKTGNEMKNRTRLETECWIGIRMKSVTGIEISNSNRTAIESRNEIGRNSKIFQHKSFYKKNWLFLPTSHLYLLFKKHLIVTPNLVLGFNFGSGAIFYYDSGNALHPNPDPTLGFDLFLFPTPGSDSGPHFSLNFGSGRNAIFEARPAGSLSSCSQISHSTALIQLY
ncbi:hypothetical protein EVAR_66885_1 [Eumeta japonica]|uniref:Uncharacterized protein n=1 Tax=Eumeta variegata TaxID=151549 RepID=A0A4C1ZRS5_EUMVA|nr:hypothetical protein EVAR_66885_1 [Eumeta japonica]